MPFRERPPTPARTAKQAPVDWGAVVRSELGREEDPRLDAVADEMADHLQDLYDEAIRGGLSHGQALARARRALAGAGTQRVRDLQPRQRSSPPPPPLPDSPSRGLTSMFTGLSRDVLYGYRSLIRTPSVTLAAVVTLALGVGPTVAVYSLLNATLFARLPVHASEQLVYVGNGPSASAVFSYPGYTDLRDRNQVFDGLIAWGGITASLSATDLTDTVSGAIVSGNFFEVLGVSAARGRVIASADDVTPGGHPVAVISDGLWQRRFGGRHDIVGSRIVLNGHSFEVLGVLPSNFHGAQVGVIRDVYVPLMMQAVMRPPRAGYSGDMNPDLLRVRTNQWLFALGRLKGGVTQEQAAAALSALQLGLDPPDRPRLPNGAQRIALARVDEGTPDQRTQFVSAGMLLTSIVAAVLLIACANTANLLLSRAAARAREMSVRIAIGAGRGRIIRQLLVESTLLAVAGGAAGVLLAFAVLQAGRAWPAPPGALPLQLDVTLDPRVLGFALLLSLTTGLLFGLAPALQTTRHDLVQTLRVDAGGVAGAFRWLTLKHALVVVQVGLSLALLVAAGLFSRSLWEAQRIESGYAVDRTLRLELPINLLRYTRVQGREFYQRAVDRVTAIPGVRSAAVARVAVLSGSGRTTSLHVEGRQGSTASFGSEGGAAAPLAEDEAFGNVVSPGYFATMGVTLQQGRDFSDLDRDGGLQTAVVNRTFVTRHFAGGEALHKRISVNGPNGPWRTIVGVVADARYRTLNEAPSPVVYLPLAQNHETGMSLYVSTHAEPHTLSDWVRREVQALEPHLPLGEAQTMQQTVGASLYLARMSALLISVLGGIALVLAAVGLYGVLAFAVGRRTREIGIRTALGASAPAVFAQVMREGLGVVAAGLGIGVLFAFATAGLIARFLVGIAPADPTTYVVVLSLLTAVAVIACGIPARRAARVDPIVALRQT